MRQRYGFRFHALRVTILCMASKGLRRTEKQITVTSPLPRRPGRPKGTHRKTSSVIRIPDELVRKCRDSLIEAKLAGGDVSTSDAVRMLAELGANVVSGELVVVNKDTWRQASLEVSQRAALQNGSDARCRGADQRRWRGRVERHRINIPRRGHRAAPRGNAP